MNLNKILYNFIFYVKNLNYVGIQIFSHTTLPTHLILVIKQLLQ
jgi:hypothetical protein